MKEIYIDSRVALFIDERDDVCFVFGGKHYTLTSQPYEPSTQIRECDTIIVNVRNAFDMYDVVRLFSEGEKVKTITGNQYDAAGFCELMRRAIFYGKSVCGIEEIEKMQDVQ